MFTSASDARIYSLVKKLNLVDALTLALILPRKGQLRYR